MLTYIYLYIYMAGSWGWVKPTADIYLAHRPQRDNESNQQIITDYGWLLARMRVNMDKI